MIWTKMKQQICDKIRQIIHSQQNYKMSTVTYNITNYEEIQRDVLARSKIIMDYKAIIDKRIKIESQYLQKMKQLYALPQMRKIPNATKASQFIYNSLINAMHSEVENITNHVSRMETEVTKLLGTTCIDLDNEVKRQLINAAIIIKEYDKKHEDIQKFRIKMIKKAHELRKLKEEYIVGTLIDMPFDKKNKLFIRTKQLEEVYRPLKQQYDHYAKLFNDKSNMTADKLKQIINRIQLAEQQKVELMKKVFMVLQISNSEYGANLIQDKASILTRINQLQAANPEFARCTQQAFEQCKKELLNYQQDPCSYISNLFTNIIDTKNMQGLVMYGHELKHRQSISESMSEPGSDGETRLECEDSSLAAVRQIVSCFKNIFHQNSEFSHYKIQRLEQLMDKSPQGRKNFILCLQKFRTLGKFNINQNKLQHIQCILNIFLNQCLSEYDTYNSKLLLVLSFTYYVIIEDKKIDLHYFIKQHKIWKEKQWWECALLQSSYQQLKIKPPKKLEQVPITIWHIKGSGLKHPQGEHQNTAQNVLFNQLIFYIQNMRLFDLKQEIITYFARKYIRYFQLPPKIAGDIQPFLKIQDVQAEDIQYDMCSPTGSPMNFKKRSSKTRKFF